MYKNKLSQKNKLIIFILFLVLVTIRFISFNWGINYGEDLLKQGYESNHLKPYWVLASDVGDEHTYNGYMGNVYALENKLKEQKRGEISKGEFLKECFYALSLNAPFSTIPVAPFIFSIIAFLCSAVCVLLGIINVNPFDFHYVYMISGRALSIILSCLIVFPLHKLLNILFKEHEYYKTHNYLSWVVVAIIASVPVFLVHTKWLSYNGPMAALEVYLLYKIVSFLQQSKHLVKLKTIIYLGFLLGFALGIKFTALAAFIVLATGSLLKFLETDKKFLNYFKSKNFSNVFKVFAFAAITYFIIILPAIASGSLFKGLASQSNMLSGGSGTSLSKWEIASNFFSTTLPVSLGYLNYLLFICAFFFVLIKFKSVLLPIKLVWLWATVIILVLFSNKLSSNPTRIITLSILAVILVWYFILNVLKNYKQQVASVSFMVIVSVISCAYLLINLSFGTNDYTNKISDWTNKNISNGKSVVLKSSYTHEQHIPVFMYENNKYMFEDSLKTYSYNFITDWSTTSFDDYKKGKVKTANRFSLDYLNQFKPCYLYIAPEIGIKGLENQKTIVSFRPEYYTSSLLVKFLQYASFNAHFSKLYYYNKNVDVYHLQ